MTLSSIADLLHRRGFSHQALARRAVERDKEKAAGRVKDTWPQVQAPRRRSEPGSPSRTRPGSR
ncbi:winged helix-turn-helix domain-containing protein [Streptomyces hyaluromycini]|uniref:Winged helix-turn-helix domain-containing protein n=1 Tax=Streptomyces hyaluromycini TaxID=1377993 RepID=A0ABV1WSH8_9ACTN